MNKIINISSVITQHQDHQLLTRLVHLDVEDISEELLVPALLCHKEPARASNPTRGFGTKYL